MLGPEQEESVSQIPEDAHEDDVNEVTLEVNGVEDQESFSGYSDETIKEQQVVSAPFTSVSFRMSCFITGTILLSHCLLLWGQIDVLWAVYDETSIDFTVEPNGTLWDILGLDTVDVDKGDEHELEGFTYADSVKELWLQDTPMTKATAVLLFLFSGLWPHVKLVTLHLFYYMKSRAGQRRSALYWLSSLGKLSLADVCVTCFLFVVLNVGVSWDLGSIFQSLVGDIPAVVLPFANRTGLDTKVLDALDSMVNNKIGPLAQALFDSNVNGSIMIQYNTLLAAGCTAALQQAGKLSESASCPAQYVEPERVRVGGLVRIATSCAFQSPSWCEKCACVTNNALYNDLVPKVAVDKVVSVMFAKLLAMAKELFDGELNSGPPAHFVGATVEGTAHANLIMLGFPGLLGFTLGVYFSIFASILVDHVDESMSLKRYRLQQAQGKDPKGATTEEPTYLIGLHSTEIQIERSWRTAFKGILVLSLIPLAVAAVAVPMFHWIIGGAFPQILFQGTNAAQYLSVVDLVGRIGQGKAFNIVFMVLFGASVVGAPIFRACILFSLFAFKWTPKVHIKLAKASNVVGAFIGWEPLFLCVILVMLEIPSITAGIVPPETCNSIKETFVISIITGWLGISEDECFIMYFNLLPVMLILLFSWATLVGMNAVAWNTVLVNYKPFGNTVPYGGPFCCCSSCGGCSADKRACGCTSLNE